ncbi:MAG: mechanosensitive ion channel [Pseudomonadales bacterium]|nr:mechanosensitive ion channel [Pseudomonadales bacterium]
MPKNLIWVLLLCCWVSGAYGLDATATATADSAEVDTRSKELKLLNQELAQLKNDSQDLVRQREQVSEEIQGAPELADQIRVEIKRLEASTEQAEVPSDLDRLESTIQLLEVQVKALQMSLADVMERIGEQQALPSVARKEVTSAQQGILEIQQEIAALDNGRDTSTLDALRISVLNQKQQNLESRKALAQFRLDGYQKLLDLYTVNRDFLLLRLDLIKNGLDLLRQKRDQLRIKAADATQSLGAEYPNLEKQAKWLKKESKINDELSKQLLEVTEGLNATNEKVVEGQQQLQEIRYRTEVAKQQLELTDYYQNVDDLLFRQRQTLQFRIRELESDTKLSVDISRARLEQFRLDEQLQRVRTETARNQTLKQLMNGNPVAEQERETVEQHLSVLLEQRQYILKSLVEAQGEYVVSLTNLELSAQEHLVALKQFYELLNKKLFWRRSGAPLNFQWFVTLPSSTLWFFTEHNWGHVFKVWYSSLFKPVYPILLALIGLGLYGWSRRYVLERLHKIKNKVGNVTKDNFRYTVEAFLITLYLSLLVPALMFLFAFPLALSEESSLFVEGFGKALGLLTVWVFLFELLRQICRKDGLALSHFMWRENAVQVVMRWMPTLYLQLPWAFVYVLVWQEGDDAHAGIVGRGAFLCVSGLFLYTCYRLFHPRTGMTQLSEGKNYWYQRWNKPVFLLMVGIPATLIVLSVRGYSFSAMEILVLIYNTIGVAFMVFVLDQVVNRWFAVAERKLAYKRAVEKKDALRKVKEQSEAAKTSGEVIPEFEMPKLDVATISAQNRSLLGVLSFTVFALLTAQIWQDFFVAVQAFQDIVLWTFTTSDDPAAELNKVTLATLIYTLIALVAIYVGVKNLPGLIEVSVLQRFDIDNGIRFAITTMARYVVIVAGVMVVSPMIGLDWTQLGWLVAALGVGLGFGLQEIFANFISGLIILFERPIRIGDTVTINNLSGTVSQIRMRATTITDWDRKELIIPNKTFVTSQFINWTLSDTTTRVVIKVGVAYGSDTDLVTKTLLDIAAENKDILDDPAPTAFFLGFGASSLDFELRGFVENFAQRLPLIHALHTEIDGRFKELGITIAFPQLDVHVLDLPKPAS